MTIPISIEANSASISVKPFCDQRKTILFVFCVHNDAFQGICRPNKGADSSKTAWPLVNYNKYSGRASAIC
jgi:glycogen synthase